MYRSEYRGRNTFDASRRTQKLMKKLAGGGKLLNPGKWKPPFGFQTDILFLRDSQTSGSSSNPSVFHLQSIAQVISVLQYFLNTVTK